VRITPRYEVDYETMCDDIAGFGDEPDTGLAIDVDAN